MVGLERPWYSCRGWVLWGRAGGTRGYGLLHPAGGGTAQPTPAPTSCHAAPQACNHIFYHACSAIYKSTACHPPLCPPLRSEMSAPRPAPVARWAVARRCEFLGWWTAPCTCAAQAFSHTCTHGSGGGWRVCAAMQPPGVLRSFTQVCCSCALWCGSRPFHNIERSRRASQASLAQAAASACPPGPLTRALGPSRWLTGSRWLRPAQWPLNRGGPGLKFERWGRWSEAGQVDLACRWKGSGSGWLGGVEGGQGGSSCSNTMA